MAFDFIADRPVLDFLATIAERGSTDLEHLTDPAALRRWAAESGLVDASPAAGPAALREAIALREATYRALDAALDGTAPAAADRDALNDAAARPLPVLRLTTSGRVAREGAVTAILAALARDALDLLAGDDRLLLRRCDDPRCTRLFIDRSRGARRRWCDMRGCGDRAKAAAYRARRRETA